MDPFNSTTGLWTDRERAEAIRRVPYVPDLISSLFPWKERGLRSKLAWIDVSDGVVSLIPSIPWDGVPVMHRPSGRGANPVQIPHFAISDHIEAAELSNTTSWTNPDTLLTLAEERDRRIEDIKPKLGLTLEALRFTALYGGIVTDSAGVQISNLYTATSTTAQAEFDLALSPSVAGTKQKLIDLFRLMKRLLKGDANAMTGVTILCDATMLDNFRKSKDFVDLHSFDSFAGVLNRAPTREEWMGVTFVEYEPGDFTSSFFGTGKGVAVPNGPNLDIFRTFFAPANYFDTVNKPASPQYFREFFNQKNTGLDLDFQTNPLPFVTRPEALIKVDDGV